jgi:hypothetical protein
LTDFKLLDEILRLERGQSTANISVASFDLPIHTLKEKIADLENKYREAMRRDEDAVRDQKSEGGVQGILPERAEEQKATV